MRMLTPQQLRTACILAETDFNFSRAAERLNTTQPSVSKTVKAIEVELGTRVFLRSSSRVIGLTEVGERVMDLARGILQDSAAIFEVAQENNKTVRGGLQIATTHACARYLLPRVLSAFSEKYPGVHCHIEQGDIKSVGDWVAQGKVALGIGAIGRNASIGLVTLHAQEIERFVIAPRHYEQFSSQPLTLADLAQCPLVACSDRLTLGGDLQQVLRNHGFTPNVALTTSDISVIKAHVSCGIGISTIPSIAIEPQDENVFRLMNATHLMPPVSLHLMFRRDHYFRSYVYDFVEMFSPQWTRRAVQDEVNAVACARSRIRADKDA